MGHIITKTVAYLLRDKEGRKTVGWILMAFFSPLILLVAFLCCLGSGAAQHNNRMIDYCFYGASYGEEIPEEFAGQMATMRLAFSSLDSAVDAMNTIAEYSGLDPIQVKAAFFVLCADGQMTPDAFASCFYTIAERTKIVTILDEGGEEVEVEETYMVSIPYSINIAYTKLDTALGRKITPEEKENIQAIYTRIAGSGGDN